MNDADLYIFTDASIYYTANTRTRSRIYGTGGGAMTAYYKHKYIMLIMVPISTRAHINTMELEQLNMTMKEINKGKVYSIIIRHQIDTIHIITDSQNCIKTLSHQIYRQDDAMIQSHQHIQTQLNDIKNNTQIQPQIHLHRVHCHDESNYNNDVDGYAKISAATILHTSNNLNIYHGREYVKPITFTKLTSSTTPNFTCTWNPNSFISYGTIKNDIKYRINMLNESIWNKYKINRSIKWAQHYDLFDIKYDKRYGDEMYQLSRTDNIIRIMLYTDQLPLNLHEYEVMESDDKEPYCT